MAEHSGKTITFGTDLLPLDDDTYFLGNENKKWKIYGDITGTISGYLPLSGGTLTGRLSVCNNENPANTPNAAAIEIREVTRGGADIEHTLVNAPRLGFHWGSRYWGQLVFHDTAFKFYDNTLTNYYPVYASTFYGDLSGNAATATSSKVLANQNGTYGTATTIGNRVTDTNIAHVNNGGVTHFKVGTATNGPAGGGNILHFYWDTSDAWDAQLHIPNNSANSMSWRASSAAGTWDSWRTLLDSSNYSSYALPLSGGTMAGAVTFTSQTSAFNDKNILFSSGGRIGGNTNGDIGIYANDTIYLKPDSTAASSTTKGVLIDSTGLYPVSAGSDYYLGTSTNKWNTVYSTTLDSSIIKLHQGTAANPSTSSNARIEFDYSGGQPVYLAYTPNDSVHVPAGLKIMGNGSTSGSNFSSPAWLEVEGTVYAAAFNGNATTATTATYSTYPKIVSGNEIRFSVNTKPSTATDIHIGYAWSDGSKDAKITGYRFKDGNNNLTQIYASVLNGSITTYASPVDITHNYILMTTTTPSATSTGTAVTSNRLWVNAADQGKFELVLGNNTPTSTAGGQYGQLALYSASSAGTYLKAADGASWSTATLQAKTGTIALTSDIPTSMAWGSITSKPTKITLTGSVTGSVDLGNGELTLATITNHNHDDAYAPIVTGGYLPLSGGTMTGTITLAATGIKTNNISGYTVDQYGNFKHQRALASDRWQLLSNGGTINFNYSWESGDLTIAGALTATNGFVGDVTGNATTLSHTLSTNTKYYISGTTLTATGTSAATFDSNLYTTITPGELSALRYSLHSGSVEKAYITYNATDDSLDFVFV